MNKIVSFMLVSIAIIVAGICIRSGLIACKVLGSTVEVRGLAERRVLSDYGQWVPRFRIVGNTLKEVQQSQSALQETLRDFFREQGFTAEEITYLPIIMEDLASNAYSTQKYRYRYSVTIPVVLTTSDVKKLYNATKNVAVLYDKGVNIIENTQRYEFTKLNDIKPEMLKEAAENAKASALIFTKDTNTKLGSLKEASQGLFTITSEYGTYDAPSMYKNIRVVTRAVYMLES